MKRLTSAVAVSGWEVVLSACAFLLATWIRERVGWELLTPGFERSGTIWMLGAVVGCWTFLLSWFRPALRGARFPRELVKVATIVAVGTVLLLAIAYTARAFYTSRALLVIFALLNLAVLGTNRAILCYLSRYYHKRGYDRACVLIVGAGDEAASHARRLEQERGLGMEVVGLLATRSSLSVAPERIVGQIDDLYSILKSRVIDEVHFAVPLAELPELQGALEACSDVGVPIRIDVGFLNGLSDRLRLEQSSDRPVLTLSARHQHELRAVLKRSFDLGVSLLGLLLAAPLIATIGLVILFTSGRPIIYRHRRIGRNGRPFMLYKFRTMVVGADRTDQREYYGPFVKVREEDARITRLGRFLRKTSLDELPQLVNVLKGDMSLVGPRPLVEEEVGRLEQWQRRRLRMRPGITGLWQASGRSELTAEERLKLDTEYVDRWSLLLDARILLTTVPSVLLRRGAR